MQTNRYANTAQFYDLVVGPHNPAVASDIDFYKKIIQPGSRVLEIGCGTGRVAIELYQHGCVLDGLDLSESMLAEFANKLHKDPAMQSRITLHQADMTAFNLETTFDWIILPFRVFQALQNDSQRRACLQAIHCHMNPRSRAVLSMFNPNPEVLALWGRNGIIDFDIELPHSSNRLRRVQNQISHDARSQIIITEHLYQVYDDQEILEEFPDRLELGYLFPEQAGNLFNSCGFFVEEVYGDYNFQPVQANIKKELIFVLGAEVEEIV